MSELTHFDALGAAIMVDVSAKPETARVAVAMGSVLMAPAKKAQGTSPVKTNSEYGTFADGRSASRPKNRLRTTMVANGCRMAQATPSTANPDPIAGTMRWRRVARSSEGAPHRWRERCRFSANWVVA